MAKVLQCVYKSLPGGDLDLFYDKVNIGHQSYAFELGKNLKSHLRLKSCRKWVVGLNINDSKKVGPKGLYGRTPGNIRVYYQNIQTSSLKPLGQLKPNFM